MFSPSQKKKTTRRDTASPSDLQALLADLNGSMDSSLNDTAESIGQPNRSKVCIVLQYAHDYNATIFCCRPQPKAA